MISTVQYFCSRIPLIPSTEFVLPFSFLLQMSFLSSPLFPPSPPSSKFLCISLHCFIVNWYICTCYLSLSSHRNPIVVHPQSPSPSQITHFRIPRNIVHNLSHDSPHHFLDDHLVILPLATRSYAPKFLFGYFCNDPPTSKYPFRVSIFHIHILICVIVFMHS